MLQLNYNELPDVAKKFFEYLNASDSNSKEFIEKPSQVLNNVIFGEEKAAFTPISTISLGNKLLFSLLKNKAFLAWSKQLQDRLQSESIEALSDEILRKEIKEVVFKHIDPSIMKEIEETQSKENSENLERSIELGTNPLSSVIISREADISLDPKVADVAVTVTAVFAVAAVVIAVALGVIGHDRTILNTPSRIHLNNLSRAISEGLISRADRGGF